MTNQFISVYIVENMVLWIIWFALFKSLGMMNDLGMLFHKIMMLEGMKSKEEKLNKKK